MHIRDIMYTAIWCIFHIVIMPVLALEKTRYTVYPRRRFDPAAMNITHTSNKHSLLQCAGEFHQLTKLQYTSAYSMMV